MIQDDYIIPFGKYQGEKIANVPANTLLWYYDKLPMKGPLYRRTKEYIEENLEDLKKEAKR
jgi:uncharacterized protein (DUF3820 family)